MNSFTKRECGILAELYAAKGKDVVKYNQVASSCKKHQAVSHIVLLH